LKHEKLSVHEDIMASVYDDINLSMEGQKFGANENGKLLL
jgi:hypothetical protein